MYRLYSTYLSRPGARRVAALGAALCALVLVTGCGDDDNPAAPMEPQLLSLGSATVGGVEVRVAGEQDPAVGLNRLTVQLRDVTSGTPVRAQVITATPMMHMPQADGSTMSHSAPHELDAAGPVDGGLGAAVVFIMAGSWELQVSFEVDGASVTAAVPIEVAPSSRVQAVTDGEARYFVTLIEPSRPRVGLNDLVVAVHRRASMMSFPPVADLALDIEPTMPSMGHGSPGNVDPAHDELGHYRGVVNFTMTGDWRIDVDLTQGDHALPEVHFEMTVE